MSIPPPETIKCKVVLIGESGVGKSSIIARYITNYFTAQITSNMAANYTTKTIFFTEENKNIKFEIWDTAGQEKYRSLAKVFYKNANAYILVYDVTQKETFNELKKYWINEVKNNSTNNVSKYIFYNIYFK